MKTDDLDLLLKLMREKGFSQVDVSNGSQRIAMKLATSSETAPVMEHMSATSAPVSAEMLRSPSIGALLYRHPLHGADGEGIAEGSRVAAGEPVAYVQAGNLLSVVVAPADGRLGQRLCETGHTVGYATPVFEFFPDEDGKAMKG